MEEHRPVVPEDVTQHRVGGGGRRGQGEAHHRHPGEGDRVQLRHRGEILAEEEKDCDICYQQKKLTSAVNIKLVSGVNKAA